MSETARLAWVIVYVPDVADAVDLYGRAFGLQPRFVGDGFAELETGATALAFASDETARQNMGGHDFRRPGPGEPPANMEIALVFDDVPAAYARAVDAGCSGVAEPDVKPHGQTVSYVRDPWGTLVEVASPVST